MILQASLLTYSLIILHAALAIALPVESDRLASSSLSRPISPSPHPRIRNSEIDIFSRTDSPRSLYGDNNVPDLADLDQSESSSAEIGTESG
jgi:hypothetical protein